jgi:hypothetical protein
MLASWQLTIIYSLVRLSLFNVVNFYIACLLSRVYTTSLGLHFDSVNGLWPSLGLTIGQEIWAHYNRWPRSCKHFRPWPGPYFHGNVCP